MPTIDQFDGLSFLIYTREHPGPAHFHVRYGEAEARVEIGTGAVASRGMPSPQLASIEAWRAEHRDWVQFAWDELRAGRNPGRAPWRG
jgi:Domain of unknown function (DUF4160)